METKKLQKLIADRGYCSRRAAEKLISEGKVKVNGELAVLGMRVKEDDKVLIEGKPVKNISEDLLIALNKPKGYVCSNKEVPGEKNIFKLVKKNKRLFSVGRLDKNSRGLVLLTNNGDLAYRLSHPSFEHEKEYEVVINNPLDPLLEEKLKEGVDIGDKTPARIKEIEKIGRKKYKVILNEGRNRQIRRMFEVFSCTVLDLKRTKIDKYSLGDLREGSWKIIKS